MVGAVDAATARAPGAASPGGVAVTADQRIERYRRAWETADAGEVIDLFPPDASYRSIVFREPFLGSDAIRQYWQRGAATQREVAVRMGRPIITGDRVAGVVDHDDRPGRRCDHLARMPPAAIRARRPLP